MSSLTDAQRQRIEENRKKALAVRQAKLQRTNGQNSVQNGPQNIAKTVFNGPVGTQGTGAQQAWNTGFGGQTSSYHVQTGQGKSVHSVNASVYGSPKGNCTDRPDWLGQKLPQITKAAAFNNTVSSNAGTKNWTANPHTSFYKKSVSSPPQNASGINNKRTHDQTLAKSTPIPFLNKFAPSPASGANLTDDGSPKKASMVKGKCLLVSRDRFLVDVGYFPPLIAQFKTMETKQYDVQTKKWSFALGEYNKLLQKARELNDGVNLEPLPRCVLSCFEDQIRGAPCKERRVPQADLSRVDDKLVSTLLPFQREGVNFSIWRDGRVLIADDMGLGKTIQALCVACYYRREWPLLIVVPSSVRFSWREQILGWLPSLDPQQINVVVTGKNSCTSALVNIISYDLMARCNKEIAQKGFKVIIMDESHFMKNQKTARTQAAFPILKKASRVILLSGTPALSRPSELFTQLAIVDAKCFSRFQEYGARYCAGKQMPWGWDFTGSSNLSELQIVLEERVMIRRLKKDVLSQLPSKVRQMVLLEPSSVKIGKNMKASHKFVDKAKGMDRRGALLEYFHKTGSAKVPAVREYIMDQLEADCKFLVFAHHQEVLDAVQEAVQKKYKYIRIDGRTSSENRNQYVEKFQTSDDVRVAILSITAANAGLNLTAASMVVFAELFWNPGILVQAEDRVHRIGQMDSVSIQYLVATGTADDFIWPLVQNKLEVLSKAGLSKDDFSKADTKQLQDPHQRDIMSYFEESFFEEDMEMPEDDPSSTTANPSTASSHQCVADSKRGTASSSHQVSLFEYFPVDNTKQSSSTDSNNSTSKAPNGSPSSRNQGHTNSTNPKDQDLHDSDWLDDEEFQDFLEEDDPDEPWPKKRRY